MQAEGASVTLGQTFHKPKVRVLAEPEFSFRASGCLSNTHGIFRSSSPATCSRPASVTSPDQRRTQPWIIYLFAHWSPRCWSSKCLAAGSPSLCPPSLCPPSLFLYTPCPVAFPARPRTSTTTLHPSSYLSLPRPKLDHEKKPSAYLLLALGSTPKPGIPEHSGKNLRRLHTSPDRSHSHERARPSEEELLPRHPGAVLHPYPAYDYWCW